MLTDDQSGFNSRRFAFYCALSWVVLFAIAMVFALVFNYVGRFEFASFLIPMLAGMDAGSRYVLREKRIPEKSQSWRQALKFNWINMAIQLVVSAMGLFMIRSAVSDLFRVGDRGFLFLVLIAVIAIVFLASWVLIRLGIFLGAKNAYKAIEHSN